MSLLFVERTCRKNLEAAEFVWLSVVSLTFSLRCWGLVMFGSLDMFGEYHFDGAKIERLKSEAIHGYLMLSKAYLTYMSIFVHAMQPQKYHITDFACLCPEVPGPRHLVSGLPRTNHGQHEGFRGNGHYREEW